MSKATVTEIACNNNCSSGFLLALPVKRERVSYLPPDCVQNRGFSMGSDGKESACNAGDPGLIPGSGRSLGEGNSYPLQYSCLENPTDRGAWQAIIHGVAKSQTQLSHSHFHFHLCLE